MNTAIILLGVAFLVENAALLIVFLVKRTSIKKNKDLHKKMRTEYNSGMVHFRSLKSLLDSTARDDRE